jgi:hypothetical protein
MIEFDWKSFESIFYRPQKAQSQQLLYELQGPLKDDSRQSLDQEQNSFLLHLSGQETRQVSFDLLDSLLEVLPEVPHCVEQFALARESLLLESQLIESKKTSRLRFRFWQRLRNRKPDLSHGYYQNFILDTFCKSWSRFLPVQHGLYLQIKDDSKASQSLPHEQELLIVFRKRHIHSFLKPDFSELNQVQLANFSERVQLLARDFMVPVQGLSLKKSQWEQWNESRHPWRQVVKDLRLKRVSVWPRLGFRWWGLLWKALISTSR